MFGGRLRGGNVYGMAHKRPFGGVALSRVIGCQQACRDGRHASWLTGERGYHWSPQPHYTGTAGRDGISSGDNRLYPELTRLAVTSDVIVPPSVDPTPT